MPFTCAQLAELRLPGYPATRQGWDKLVKEKNWSFEEFRGAGRGGIRREYTPPPEVQALIDARLRGELPTAPVRQSVPPRVASPAAPCGEIDPARLRLALIITDDAAAAQPMSVDQRADMAASVYIRLSKKE